MKFAIFCLAASLAALSAGFEPVMGSSGQLQKRSPDQTNAQTPPTSLPTSPPQTTLPYCCPPCPQPTYTCPQEQLPQLSRELPLGKQGSIQVRNEGFNLLKFYLEYEVQGQKITKESDIFTYKMQKIIDIPADAENIGLTVQSVRGPIAKDIVKKQWKYPVIKCYASATYEQQSAKEVTCN